MRRRRPAATNPDATGEDSPRHACIAAAKRHLLAGGGAVPRVAEVVAAAGVERVTFYRHFESVAALLAAVDVQRTTEGERDEALTVLVRSASVGLLDVTELTHRADVVLRASSWRELRAALADLPHTGAFTAPAPRSCR